MRDLDDTDEAVRVGRRLVEELRRPLTAAGNELTTTASLGIAIATAASEVFDLMREADTALYRAKDEGRDRYSLYNEDLRREVTERLVLEEQLRPALERGELTLWYQPEIDLATGTVTAVEALLRWNHPSGEVYAADRFIDVAEDTGLILDIGDWVLRQAAAQAATWAGHDPDLPLVVRVNLSALQLGEAGLVAAIDEALAASGVDPSLLCVETTETALLRGGSTVTANLRAIRHRALRLAVDDFGVGYASLAYLPHRPVDVIKIDRSLVRTITTVEQTRQLVAGVIAFAGQLGITVTAEGVEQWDQAALLHEIGCTAVQGFLYSAAVPPEEIPQLRARVFPRP
jgi:EAL domain-containing protein (putative c-di-GMP-specific phosphodiesterase class I)